jgi:hypothetical protein
VWEEVADLRKSPPDRYSVHEAARYNKNAEGGKESGGARLLSVMLQHVHDDTWYYLAQQARHGCVYELLGLPAPVYPTLEQQAAGLEHQEGRPNRAQLGARLAELREQTPAWAPPEQEPTPFPWELLVRRVCHKETIESECHGAVMKRRGLMTQEACCHWRMQRLPKDPPAWAIDGPQCYKCWLWGHTAKDCQDEEARRRHIARQLAVYNQRRLKETPTAAAAATTSTPTRSGAVE